MSRPVRQVGRYVLYEPLASGGMATVYLGRLAGPVGFSRTVAIKRLHPHLAEQEEFVAMFLDEARLAARIRHPNVVPTLDVVAQGGELFLVMEYVQGEPLGKLLRTLAPRGEHIPPRTVSAILCDALHGLHAAHETKDEQGTPLGIIHRDVSPQNILVGTDGSSRVLDFGIAKAVGRVHSTREGQVKGKIAYMAPEQLTGRAAGRAADVYAASVVLWEALTGKRLFQSDTTGDLVGQIVHAKIPPPSAHMSEPLDALDKLVLRGLSRVPEDRFLTAKEMATALEACLRPAPRATVSEWVEHTAAEALAERARLVAQVTGDESPAPAPGELLSALRSSTAPPEAARLTTTTSATSIVRTENKPRTRPRAVLGAVAAVLLVTAGIAGLSTLRGGQAPAAVPLTSASPPPAVVTDPRDLTTSNPEARAAYLAALQAMRDGSFDDAMESFERATTLDPSFGAAFLRLAICRSQYAYEETQTRREFSRAAQLRFALSPGDQGLLDAFEPYFQREPSDVGECETRLSKQLDQSPRDPEVAFYLGLVRLEWGRMKEASAAFERATSLDPKFALALAMAGGASAYAGDFEAARRSLDTCLLVSPSGADCFWYRILIEEQRGECAREEADAKAWIARDEDDLIGYKMLAQALAAQGRPRDAVRAALEQRWAKTRPAMRAGIQALDSGRLAALAGDFVGAEGYFRDELREATQDPSAVTRVVPVRMLLDLYRETDRPELAVGEAKAYLGRSDAWVAPHHVDDFTLANDPVPLTLGTLLHSGGMPLSDFQAKQGDWLGLWRQRTTGSYASYLWVYGLAYPAETRDEARRALELLPDYLPLPVFTPQTMAPGVIGAAFLLAGRVDEALPWLQAAVASCAAFTEPFEHTRASYHLGLALELKGEREGACGAYARVRQRWGAAKPKSVTADKAKARALALGCPP